MTRAAVMFSILLASWLLWSGFFVPLIITFGVASCAFVVGVGARMRIFDREGVPIQFLPRLVAYVPWLMLEIAKSNVDMARRILRPRIHVTPVLFDVPSSQREDVGRVLFANSITLTPGTVSFEVEPGTIRVHAIAKEVRDDLLKGEMDRRCTHVEGSG